jgi:Pyruvate/2-oxoglutarate dehydrogenase complex, dihydrolipoamide acyltransferase (E2) component, and related enzymes
MFRRSLVGAVAIAGALGLAACNNDTASVSTPTGSAPTAAATSKATTTEAAPPTSSDAPTSEASTTSSAAATPSSSSTSAAAKTDDAKLTPTGTKLQYGKGATINSDSDGKFTLSVKSIAAAPESAYAVANLNKTNGKMYYINFDVTYRGGAKYGFRPSSVNFLELRPVFDSSEKGRSGGSPFQDLPGCKKTPYKDMAVGDTSAACYYYQVTGPAPTKVMWDDYTTNVVWSK